MPLDNLGGFFCRRKWPCAPVWGTDRSCIQPRRVELGGRPPVNASSRHRDLSEGPGRLHRGRKFAVLRNASKNIGTLCLRWLWERALSVQAGRVGSGGRAWLCGLAGVRRFRSDSRNGGTELPWGCFGDRAWGQASGCLQIAGVWVNNSACACLQQVAAVSLLLPLLLKLHWLGRRC